MPSTYTSNNRLEKPGIGEQSGGAWGNTENNNYDLLDQAIDGFVVVTLSGTTHTLNIPDAVTANGRNKVISFTGTLAAANTVTITPNTVEKLYFFQNNTTGGQNVIIAQGSGSTVTIKPGYSSIVYLDGAGTGASAKEVLTSLKLTALLEATGVVFVGSGSGSTTLQANAAASGTLTLPAATDTLVGKATTDTLTNKTLDTAGAGNVLRINGTQVTAVTGTGSVVLATSPTLTTPTIATNATVPVVIGGTGTTSTLALRSTSGVGTAGADIVFQTGNNGATEAARITNAGNVGINTPSPQTLLTVGSYSAGTGEATTRGYIQIQDPFESATLDGNRGLEFKNSPSGFGFGWKMGGVGGVNFAIGNRHNSATFVERVRIDSNGNVGINTVPSNPLHVNGVVQIDQVAGSADLYMGSSATGLGGRITYDNNNARLLFSVGGSERARLDSSTGNFSVGSTTLTNGRIYAQQSGGARAMAFSGDAGTTVCAMTTAANIAYIGAISGGGVASQLCIDVANGRVGIGTAAPANQLQLSLDSASKPSTNTWTIASDARLKTVRGEYEKGLAEICALRPVRYEYNGKGGFAADGAEHVSILAQELQEVFPECVSTFRGKLEEDQEELDLLNYNGHAITFALINAVKELKAMIEAKK